MRPHWLIAKIDDMASRPGRTRNDVLRKLQRAAPGFALVVANDLAIDLDAVISVSEIVKPPGKP